MNKLAVACSLSVMLLLFGCENTDSDSNSSSRPDDSAGETPDEGEDADATPAARQAERFRWAFQVQVKNQENVAIAGASITVTIIDDQNSYNLYGWSNQNGRGEFSEVVHSDMEAVISVSKGGYVSQSQRVRAGRQSLYFYLATKSY